MMGAKLGQAVFRDAMFRLPPPPCENIDGTGRECPSFQHCRRTETACAAFLYYVRQIRIPTRLRKKGSVYSPHVATFKHIYQEEPEDER